MVRRSVLASTALLAFVTAGDAWAVSFAYEVDRFETGANVFEFAGGSLDPAWTVAFGTATVGGGVVSLGDPGTSVPINVSGTVLVMERTDIRLDLGPLPPSGPVHTSTWNFATPAVNDWLGMFFTSSYSIAAQDNAGIFLANFDAATAAAVGAVPGLQILQWEGHRVADVWTFSIESHLIAPEAVTGQLVLEMENVGGTWTHRFSLDGGSSFVSPFTPIAVGVAPFNVTLAADPIVSAPDPNTALLLASSLLGLRVRRRHPLRS